MIKDLLILIKDILWTGPVLSLLLIAGALQTWRTGFIQKHIFTFSKQARGSGEISPMQSLMTALAGAIGTGNIAGIATAITMGGFGALFWMWIFTFFAMAVAYSETFLAIIYRKNSMGGPMMTISHGLHMPWLGKLFAIFCIFSSFGYAMVQGNSVVDATISIIDFPRYQVSIVLVILAATVILGGIKRIANTASALVPLMASLYIIICLLLLSSNYDKIPAAFNLILVSAFKGQSAIGGFAGATVLMAIQNGALFGMFANEAGLGSFAIASASAKTTPQQQGRLAMQGVFFATVLICTMTGLVLAVAGVFAQTIDGKLLTGSMFAMKSFQTFHPYMGFLVLVCLVLFAFTTILAWEFYGEKALEFLFNKEKAKLYRYIYSAVLFIGGIIELELVWTLAHLANGLMAFVNIWSILMLGGKANVTKHSEPVYEHKL